MATEVHYFSGECQWAKVHTPDTKYEKYSIDVKLDENQASIYNGLGVKAKIRDNGFVTFRRDPNAKMWKDKVQMPAGAPVVLGPDNSPFKDAIGNGSIVTCKLMVYDYNHPKFGKGKSCRLEAVKVDKLVVYKPEEKALEVNTTTGVKPRILF